MAKAAKYIGALGVALAAAAALAGAAGAPRWGWRAYEASAIAALLNWLAGSAALATVLATRGKPYRVNGALAAMVARMFLPLAAVLFVTRTGHPLTSYGFTSFLVVHYLIGLAVETAMTVRLVASSESLAPPPGKLALKSDS